MTQWEGKAKGTPLGYKIFIFCIKKLGLNVAYSVLLFVSFYYVVFSFSTTRTSYIYFRKRLKQPFLKSIISAYKNYFTFGQTLIDRAAISFGLKDKYTFTYDGREKIQEILDQKKGGIIFSGHVGNFNIARYFFDELDLTDTAVNLMVTDQESEQLKKYVGSVTYDSGMKFIAIKNDMSHIFEMNEALAKGEIIIFAADRYVEGIQYLEQEFLGKIAKFPSGPYKLAARKKTPILFVYIMKGKNKFYHLYAKEPKFSDVILKPSHILKEYIRNTEIMLKKYPLQWFNYYDYWEDIKNQ